MTRVVARPDEIRRNNLGLVLEQVHRDGELSRAELTVRLGVNRSTIGGLVSELVELGLVDEIVPSGHARAGRPSHVVGPRSDGPFAVAVDLDVESVQCAAVGIGGRMLTRNETWLDADRRTPEDVCDVIERGLAAVGASLPAGSWPVGIGISVPGTVQRSDQHVAFAPNLDWTDVAFGDLVEKRLTSALPIEIGNDADLGAMAEHLRGAAKGCNDAIFLTGRIGVGGGIIIDGRAVRGHTGLAGEIGHVVLDPLGPLCHCGNRGCVESYISEAAALRMAGRPGPVNRQTIDALVRSVEEGDPAACASVGTAADYLGRTVANLVNLLNPELIILGGWLTDVLRLAGDQVRASTSAHTMPVSRDTVVLSTPGLGRDSTLLGAAELAFQHLLAAPHGRA